MLRATLAATCSLLLVLAASCSRDSGNDDLGDQITYSDAFDREAFESEINETVGSGVHLYVTDSAEIPPDMRKGLRVIEAATEQMRATICGHRARPERIVMAVTESFGLALSDRPGIQVEWDIDKVCER